MRRGPALRTSEKEAEGVFENMAQAANWETKGRIKIN